MTMNGHFASVGDGVVNAKDKYEHGIQVIDEEKQYKCVSLSHAIMPPSPLQGKSPKRRHLLIMNHSLSVPISTHTSP